mmetsp:Transcript_42329/g.95504  ORF Transcript_42329/g.95504 Transcript_42329/m.95504 type:complete len:301 (-) Transcript_42329:122-1024(-)
MKPTASMGLVQRSQNISPIPIVDHHTRVNPSGWTTNFCMKLFSFSMSPCRVSTTTFHRHQTVSAKLMCARALARLWAHVTAEESPRMDQTGWRPQVTSAPSSFLPLVVSLRGILSPTSSQMPQTSTDHRSSADESRSCSASSSTDFLAPLGCQACSSDDSQSSSTSSPSSFSPSVLHLAKLPPSSMLFQGSSRTSSLPNASFFRSSMTTRSGKASLTSPGACESLRNTRKWESPLSTGCTAPNCPSAWGTTLSTGCSPLGRWTCRAFVCSERRVSYSAFSWEDRHLLKASSTLLSICIDM